MSDSNSYFVIFDNVIKDILHAGASIFYNEPRKFMFMMRMISRLSKTSRLRARWREKDLEVPPLLIMSITNLCNLKCKGCYSMEKNCSSKPELSNSRIAEIIREANEIGVSIVMIAGGEPLLKPEIINIAADFRNMIFPLFTNGLLMTGELADRIKPHDNILPIISIEGMEEETDERRGRGVWERLKPVMVNLKQRNIFFGASITVTSRNFGLVTSDEFIKQIIDAGARIIFYIEYVPVTPGSDELIVEEWQRVFLQDMPLVYQKKFPALFVSFPGDEDKYGGCLAAGRGFIHINAIGDVEPCPFAPFSDYNLREGSLQEALRSDLMKKIRENHHLLTETNGGCALWANKELLTGLVTESSEESIEVK